MYLNHIRLEQFRCYQRQELTIPPCGLRLAGSNASGKTSFVEAVQVLATMKSSRASAERELINWTSNQEFNLPPYARVMGWISDSDAARRIEVSLAVDPQRSLHTRKQIKIDDQPSRAIDAVGRFKTVIFEPEDMELVLGSPTVRRRYLDVALSTLDPTYLRLLSQYNKILEQRNSLLKSIRDQASGNRRARMPELEYWDHELINRAAYIIAARIRFLSVLRETLTDSFQALLGEGHELQVEYASSGDQDVNLEQRVGDQDAVEGQRVVAQWMQTAISRRRNEEFARGVTAVGPQRDDINLLLDGRGIDAFGSRGQQRLAVVAIKLSEVRTINAMTGATPVLLLDDVLSELDRTRQARLLSQIADLGGQVIVTATDSGLLQAEQLHDLPMYQVDSGNLNPA